MRSASGFHSRAPGLGLHAQPRGAARLRRTAARAAETLCSISCWLGFALAVTRPSRLAGVRPVGRALLQSGQVCDAEMSLCCCRQAMWNVFPQQAVWKVTCADLVRFKGERQMAQAHDLDALLQEEMSLLHERGVAACCGRRPVRGGVDGPLRVRVGVYGAGSYGDSGVSTIFARFEGDTMDSAL